MANKIGTLAEKSLHQAIKKYLYRSGDQIEVPVDGFVVDLVHGRELIEIQTANFGALKGKLAALLKKHPVTVVHPVAAAKWIVRQTAAGEQVSRRKSPRHGSPLDIFAELVRMPHLLIHPNLKILLLMTHQEEVWRDDGQGSWRRRHWSIADRRLLQVIESMQFSTAADYRRLLPDSLPHLFTNRELAGATAVRPRLAGKMTYTLFQAGVLERVGKRGNAFLYVINRQV